MKKPGQDLDDKEVEELLNIHVEKIEDLDLDLPEDITKNNLKAFPELESLPAGKAGLEAISKSQAVLRIDEELSRTIWDKPRGKPMKESITQMKTSERTEKYKTDVQGKFDISVIRIAELYHRLAVGNSVSHTEILEIIERFFNIYFSDPSILLNLLNYHSSCKDYLYPHVLKVCLLSMNIASTCGFSKEQVLEVGEAALLADLGMILIPREIRFHKGKLTPDEFFEIQKHPMLGLHLLEKIRGMPAVVSYVSYQHHERNSGRGYPKGRKGRLVHGYARMVSIADVFLALCSPRSYRKPLAPYQAMVKTLQMGSQDFLDRTVLKKLVELTSLFPVGSLVKLTDGRIAKVIRANAMDVHQPVVSIMDKGSTADEINLLVEKSIQILEPVESGHEFNLMDGF